MIEFKSRYDYYKPGESIDEESRDQYPDPLSIDFSKGKLSKVPTAKQITSAEMDKFWLYFFRKYEVVDRDDMLLHINGIPYAGMMEPGSVLYELVAEDLDGWITKQPKDVD